MDNLVSAQDGVNIEVGVLNCQSGIEWADENHYRPYGKMRKDWGLVYVDIALPLVSDLLPRCWAMWRVKTGIFDDKEKFIAL